MSWENYAKVTEKDELVQSLRNIKFVSVSRYLHKFRSQYLQDRMFYVEDVTETIMCGLNVKITKYFCL